MTANFFHIDDLSQGLPRELVEGVTTRIFPVIRRCCLWSGLRPMPKAVCTAIQKNNGVSYRRVSHTDSGW